MSNHLPLLHHDQKNPAPHVFPTYKFNHGSCGKQKKEEIERKKNKFLELRTVTFATDSVMVDPIRAGPFIFDASGDQSQ